VWFASGYRPHDRWAERRYRHCQWHHVRAGQRLTSS